MVGRGGGSLPPVLPPPRLRLERQVRVRTVERFEGAAAESLLPMTPFYWKATREKQRDIGIRASSEGIETAVDFECFTYRAACDGGDESRRRKDLGLDYRWVDTPHEWDQHSHKV
jgi:hypothetical protein